jgi:hypothetical protein
MNFVEELNCIFENSKILKKDMWSQSWLKIWTFNERYLNSPSVRPSNTHLVMTHGIFKYLLLSVPLHNGLDSGKSEFCPSYQSKFSQDAGSRIDSTDTISKRLIRVDSLIYPFHLKKIADPGSETSLVCWPKTLNYDLNCSHECKIYVFERIWDFIYWKKSHMLTLSLCSNWVSYFRLLSSEKVIFETCK